MNKFGDAIRTRREEKDLLLRHVAASLDVDTAMLSKIERGERKAKREQVIEFAKLLHLNETDLLTLWLADKVYDVIQEEDLGLNALKVAEKEIKYNKKKL
jgi:HTH-type transcriptional regulator, competence development regulator